MAIYIASKPGVDFGIDTSIPNVVIHEPPKEVIEFRTELSREDHKELREYVISNGIPSFEEALGIIAMQLGIVLDGNYNVPQLCHLLTKKLSEKRKFLSAKKKGIIIPSSH